MLKTALKKPPQRRQAKKDMFVNKIIKTLSFFFIITLGITDQSYGEESVNTETNTTLETLPQEVDVSTTLQTCQTYISDLENRFKQLKKPRLKLLFFRSLRAKKYQAVEENLADFKIYVERKMTLLVGENAPKEEENFIKDCTNYYRMLRDKILWIDDFRNKNLRYFANHTYADTFFKKQNSVINRKVTPHERKSYDYQKDE
jgi:hypothetical protein